MNRERLRTAGIRTLARGLLYFLLAAVVGLATQRFWPVLAVAALAALFWSTWRLHRVLSRLAGRRRMSPNTGQGLWNALESALYRRERRVRARIGRLLEKSRGHRRAAAAMHDGGVIVERSGGRIVWFNKAARRLLGLPFPDALGRRLPDVVDSPDARDWFDAARTDEPLADVPSPADPGMRLSLRLLPFSDTEWLVVVRDVTQLMRLEHARRDFVANVSHELRTPLTVVNGYLELIEPEDDAEWTPMLAEMRRQSRRMTQLVEDLLMLSRLEARQQLPEGLVAMAPMLATLRREAAALSQGRHAIDVTDSAGCDLQGSPGDLHSAFSNLVGNAVRYTPDGGRIDIRFERTVAGGVALTVRDSGYGIPAEHIPRITERFYRIDTSRSRASGGTGLGLSIVKHVLHLHQARLEIRSRVGDGSSFACVFGTERVRARASDRGEA